MPQPPHLDRRRVLVAALALPVAGCMVGGLRPPIAERFGRLDIATAEAAGTLDPSDRRRLAELADEIGRDVFARALEPGAPDLPTLEVRVVAVDLAREAATVTVFGREGESARDRLVAEWAIVSPAGRPGPRLTLHVDRPAHRPGETAILDRRDERIGALLVRLFDRLWDALRA